MNPPRAQRLVSLSALVILALAAPFGLRAQSDNFDSGTLSSAWTKYYANPALAAFSFPTVGNGKGLRMQANPYPLPASRP